MKYPRVTEILRPFSNYDKVPYQILERAAARGTTVHALCAGIAKGEWIPEAMITEEIVGYVRSFKLWAKDTVKSYEIIEKRFQHTILEYTGQVDFVITTNDNFTYIIDLKTSAQPQKTYPIQMAAYESLLFANNIIVNGAILVYLNKEGKYPKVHAIDFEEEMKVFMSALECYKYFNPGKKDDNRRDIPCCSTEHIPESTQDNGGT